MFSQHLGLTTEEAKYSVWQQKKRNITKTFIDYVFRVASSASSILLSQTFIDDEVFTRCRPPHLSVSDSIQRHSQVHIFLCKVLSHVVHPCLCLSSATPFLHPHSNIELLLVISCLLFSPHAKTMSVFFCWSCCLSQFPPENLVTNPISSGLLLYCSQPAHFCH